MKAGGGLLSSVWVSKHNEFISSSRESFEAAACELVERANRTLRGVTGLEVLSKRVKILDNGELEFRLQARLLLDVASPEGSLHW